MPHPLDTWIAARRKLQLGSVIAYIGDDFPNEFVFDEWPAERIRLSRMLFQRTQKEMNRFVAERLGCNLDDLDAGVAKAWVCPLSEMLSGAKTKLVKPKCLFSVDFSVDGAMMSWGWGWAASTFTKDLALVWQWDDEFIGQKILPRPLGLVSQANLIPSTALLFSKLRGMEPGNRFEKDSFWGGIKTQGLALPALYRLLLASTQLGGKLPIIASDDEIVHYRSKKMAYGYEDVQRVINETKGRRLRLEDPTAYAKTLTGLAKVAFDARECKACAVADRPVFGRGSEVAQMIIVGDMPRQADVIEPFSGSLGGLLNDVLERAGFELDQIYFCNIIKCKTCMEQLPKASEVAACTSILRKQVEAIRPKAIVLLGEFAAQTLLETNKTMESMRGDLFTLWGIPTFVTYHPDLFCPTPQPERLRAWIADFVWIKGRPAFASPALVARSPKAVPYPDNKQLKGRAAVE